MITNTGAVNEHKKKSILNSSIHVSEGYCCPLCHATEYTSFGIEFNLCETCKGIYRPPKYRPSATEEKARYETHNNDVEDLRYQAFVTPVVSAVNEYFTQEHLGLDFGAGTGPVISKLLRDRGFNIVQYDPFFDNNVTLLENFYDYIICCEVIEHFHSPNKEFTLLKRLLNPGGRIYCMTHLYDSQINFAGWYYRKDPTHVFIYQQDTMQWIKTAYDFSSCITNNRLTTLVN